MSLLRNLVLSWVLSLVSLVSGVATAAASELPNLDPLRFANEIMAFQEWEAKNTLPEGGILFVGSSSIRMWPTAAAFPQKVITNRGFGGAEFPDIFYYYERVIAKYAPAKILLYVGDNDVSRGKSADAVFRLPQARGLGSARPAGYRAALYFREAQPGAVALLVCDGGREPSSGRSCGG